MSHSLTEFHFTTPVVTIKRDLWKANNTETLFNTTDSVQYTPVKQPSMDSDSTVSRASTLCVLWILIVFGNSLVLAVSWYDLKKHIPSFLIFCLAMADLINGLVPVTISICMYSFTKTGFKSLQWTGLCMFYNWSATTLRLSSCFIATMMAVDRAISVYRPLYYRTTLVLKKVRRAVLLFATLSILLASIPFSGIPKVYPFGALCSFDFGSSYAGLIMILGYIQFVIVAVSYFLVVKGLVGFIERQASMRRNQQRPSMVDFDDVVKYLAEGRRKSSSVEIMRDIRIFKTSKKIAKTMGIVVLLFYVSWMPIVVSITVRLATHKYGDTLHFIAARMSLISSTANPLIYGITSRTYRRGYLRAIRSFVALCGFKKSDDTLSDTSGVKSDPAVANRCRTQKTNFSNQPIVNHLGPAIILSDDETVTSLYTTHSHRNIRFSVDIGQCQQTESNEKTDKEIETSHKWEEVKIPSLKLSLEVGLNHGNVMSSNSSLHAHTGSDSDSGTRETSDERAELDQGFEGDSEGSDRLTNQEKPGSYKINKLQCIGAKNSAHYLFTPERKTKSKKFRKRSQTEERKNSILKKRHSHDSLLTKFQKERSMNLLTLTVRSSSDEEESHRLSTIEAINSERHRSKYNSMEENMAQRQMEDHALENYVDNHFLSVSDEEPTFL